MRGAPGQDGNLAASVAVFQPDSRELAEVRSWELGREVIASGTDLSAEAQCQAALALRDDGVRWLDLGTVDTDVAPGLAHFKLGTGAELRQLGATVWVLPGRRGHERQIPED